MMESSTVSAYLNYLLIAAIISGVFSVYFFSSFCLKLKNKQLFNYPLTSCPFVKRKWKVIDWCQYDDSGSTNSGLWEYSQYIYITNDVAPTILSVCNDTTVCAPGNSCDAIALNFSISAIIMEFKMTVSSFWQISL